jgi:hypothetical protein
MDLNENDIKEIGAALSFIWTKMNFQLKNIAITDKMGSISYGKKRTDRITVDLEEIQVYIIKFSN